MTDLLKGVVPALVTPLTPSGTLAVKSMEQLLDRMYTAGVDGMYVCGQTGEGLMLPLETRQAAAEVCVRNTPAGKAVIVHVGASRTDDAVQLASHARKAGAHAVSSLPPAASFSFEEVKGYYTAIAAAAELPVLVYYFPEFSRSVTTLEQIYELCAIPGVAGLKFTDFDLYRLSLISRAGHVIYSGRDEVFAAGVLMGASGGIGSFFNVIPELFVKVWQLGRDGRHTEARATQDRINDLIHLVLHYPMLPALKTMLGWSGIDCGEAVGPRRPLTIEERSQLRTELVNAGFDPETAR